MVSLLESVKKYRDRCAASQATSDSLTTTQRISNLEQKRHETIQEERKGIKIPSKRRNDDFGNHTGSTPSGVSEKKRWKPVHSNSFYTEKSKGLRAKSTRESIVELQVLAYLSKLKHKANQKQHDRVWRMFASQQEAFDFVDEEDPDGEWLHVFSLELEANGKRKFLASTYVEFWRRYKDIPQRFKHYYEIIRELRPCNLYLDLEFERVNNPELDGEEAVEATMILLRHVLKDKLNFELDAAWAIELDSSNETKFSRHMIIRLPGVAFKDNTHVGAFVGEMMRVAHQSRKHRKPYEKIFVKNRYGEETTFIDCGVYSRNRAFRLWLSSKAGKQVPLVLSQNSMTHWRDIPDEKIFMFSLVGNVDVAASTFLSCAAPSDNAQSATISLTEQKRVSSSSRSDCLKRGPSPYPMLEAFVVELCRRNNGKDARVRSWAVLDDGSVMLFNIQGYRYCGNIGREHKSNGIFIVVDLKNRQWYQKCYDPDCSTYKSPSTSLPEDLVL